MNSRPLIALRSLALASLCVVATGAVWAAGATSSAPGEDAGSAAVAESPSMPGPAGNVLSERETQTMVGKASLYHERMAGRPMADGSRMDPSGDNAASKTLPLGTKARVTNLVNGRTAVVTIQDRGPYVKGRIIDVSPATARLLGFGKRAGVAHVAVTPLELR